MQLPRLRVNLTVGRLRIRITTGSPIICQLYSFERYTFLVP
ncbi:hypothetical protein E2C01_044329 [Portunus trituberculatus]|uniref:Uncharacterized protein n=1 Tax=Portunus trituberculatus TaxID=210409 RepID=A0A5B7FRU1_PORTR|nr:hypothetical protein [Portunus trituberculatus]